MKNYEVAELLDKLAQLSEAAGDDRFKVIAYRRATKMVLVSAEPSFQLQKVDGLSKLVDELGVA